MYRETKLSQACFLILATPMLERIVIILLTALIQKLKNARNLKSP